LLPEINYSSTTKTCPPHSVRRLLVLRHGPIARLQGVAISAGYEPTVQHSRLTLRRSSALACLADLRTLSPIRTGTRIATTLILSTRTLSDMDALDKRLYTSHPAPTDSVSRLEPDRVKLARNGCMLPSVVRLSLSNCSHQLHLCTVLKAAHHIHTRPPDVHVHACLTYPKSLSHTYSSLELSSFPSV
jgi:hypothetical protein